MGEKLKLRLGWHTFRLVVVFVILFTVVYSAISWLHFIETPVLGKGEHLTYTLKPGTSLRGLASDLHKAGKMPDPRLFVLFARLKDSSDKLQAGHYEFEGPLTPGQLLQEIVGGNIRQSQLTLIDGWTFARAMQAIEASPTLTHDLKGLSAPQVMAKLGHPQQHPEGLFFPDTYHFPRGMSDIKFLQDAYRLMEQHLTKEWMGRSADLPFTTSYQALIAASLVEKETALSTEKSEVAGVLIRRLQKRMLLQFDPTIIYGLGKQYNGNITRADLRKNTPYNTYIHRGLPPTPISLPSLSSIHAVMHPAKGSALYFVADGKGGHVFSDTLRQHNKNVRRYVKMLRQNKRRLKQINEAQTKLISKVKP